MLNALLLGVEQLVRVIVVQARGVVDDTNVFGRLLLNQQSKLLIRVASLLFVRLVNCFSFLVTIPTLLRVVCVSWNSSKTAVSWCSIVTRVLLTALILVVKQTSTQTLTLK